MKIRKTNYFFAFISLVFLVACNNNKKQKNINVKQKDTPSIENSIVSDTLRKAFPIGIGNDDGVVDIVSITTIKNKELIKSDFQITLNGFKDYYVDKQFDKSDIINKNKSTILKDTITGDYLNGAILKLVEFEFVRGKTLYFNAISENFKAKKTIYGRFCLTYTTNKKGEIYGWITDEVIDFDKDPLIE